MLGRRSTHRLAPAREPIKCGQDSINCNGFAAIHPFFFRHRHLDRVIGPAPQDLNLVFVSQAGMLDDGIRLFED